MKWWWYVLAFLSRLCGGELFLTFLDVPHSFLSRLCGGELGWVAQILRL